MSQQHDEAALELALLDLYQEWGALGYWARRFYQMVSPHCIRYKGGVAAVRGLLAKDQTAGFAFLKERRRLDLTVEHLVLAPEWHGLFTEEDRNRARMKLNDRTD